MLKPDDNPRLWEVLLVADDELVREFSCLLCFGSKLICTASSDKQVLTSKLILAEYE